MKRHQKLSTFAAVALALVANAASAQNPRNCGPREMVVDRLSSAYGETRQSIGLGTNNQVMEVFASNETGSWTITVTLPSGMTCLVATGQSFETLSQADLPSTDPAL